MSQKLETLDYAADVLNLRRKQAEELARRGVIPIVRVGRKIRIDPAVLEEWIRAGGKPLAGGWRREAQ